MVRLKMRINKEQVPSFLIRIRRGTNPSLLKACYLKGSSMVELTVAMVILILVTGTALMIYLQVTRSGQTLQRLRWQLRLNAYAQQTKKEASYHNGTQVFEDGVLEKKVSLYQQNQRLLLLELTFVPDRTEENTIRSINKNFNDKEKYIEKYIYREIVFRESSPQ